jgi:hypothetical protein
VPREAGGERDSELRGGRREQVPTAGEVYAALGHGRDVEIVAAAQRARDTAEERARVEEGGVDGVGHEGDERGRARGALADGRERERRGGRVDYVGLEVGRGEDGARVGVDGVRDEDVAG